MPDLDDLIEKYHEKHDVVYTLMVEVDGEILRKETSGISADDLVGFAWMIDETVEKTVIEEIESAAEYKAEQESDEARGH